MMKFEIDKKTGSIIAVVAVTAFIIGGALNANRNDGWSTGWMGMHHSSSSNFSSNDIMFAQMMIPHHQQAIEMSDLALKISKNAQVIALAAKIKAAQAPEIAQMKKWLKDSNSGMEMGHDMGMNGMLSESELTTLKSSTGKTFDQLFLQGMIGHHEGAIAMVNLIEKSSNAEVKKLGSDIVKSQSAEILEMKGYLATL